MSARAERAQHRAFLNRYYGAARGTYDVTRRFYLVGRDRALDQILERPWSRLVEIGPGTGRNLRRLYASRPEAQYAGIDACDRMLEYARRACPWARFVSGFAEDAQYDRLFYAPPDVVLFSYALSMFGNPAAALSRAVGSIGDGGRVVAVDFGDFGTIPWPVAPVFRTWLSAFHVAPVSLADLGIPPASLEFGPGRYFAIATFGHASIPA